MGVSAFWKQAGPSIQNTEGSQSPQQGETGAAVHWETGETGYRAAYDKAPGWTERTQGHCAVAEMQ